MSKVDKIKEKINNLRFWLGIFVALFISISAWLVNNFNKNNFLFYIGIAFIILLFVLIFLIHKKINKYIDELEDL